MPALDTRLGNVKGASASLPLFGHPNKRIGRRYDFSRALYRCCWSLLGVGQKNQFHAPLLASGGVLAIFEVP